MFFTNQTAIIGAYMGSGSVGNKIDNRLIRCIERTE